MECRIGCIVLPPQSRACCFQIARVPKVRARLGRCSPPRLLGLLPPHPPKNRAPAAVPDRFGGVSQWWCEEWFLRLGPSLPWLSLAYSQPARPSVSVTKIEVGQGQSLVGWLGCLLWASYSRLRMATGSDLSRSQRVVTCSVVQVVHSCSLTGRFRAEVRHDPWMHWNPLEVPRALCLEELEEPRPMIKVSSLDHLGTAILPKPVPQTLRRLPAALQPP